MIVRNIYTVLYVHMPEWNIHPLQSSGVIVAKLANTAVSVSKFGSTLFNSVFTLENASSMG